MSERRSSRGVLFWTFVFLLLVVDAILAWHDPGSDVPNGYARESALVTESYLHLDEARAWVLGEESGVSDEYRRPLVTLPAALFFRVGGFNFMSARGVAWLGSAATILLLAVVLRRRFGSRLAVLSLIVFAVHPAWHAVVRSASIYPWMAFWLLLIVTLAMSRRRSGVGWALGISVVTAVFLDPLLAAGIPLALLGLGQNHLRARGDSSPVMASGILCTAAGLLIAGIAWHLGTPSWDNFNTFEKRTGVMGSMPMVLTLAWVGALLFTSHVFVLRKGHRSQDRLVHCGLWSLWFGFALSPGAHLRHFIFVFPLLVYAATYTLQIAAVYHRRRAESNGWQALWLLPALALTVFWVSQLRFALSEKNLSGTGLCLMVALVVSVAALGAPWRVRVLRKALLPLCFILLPIPMVSRALVLIDDPNHSIQRTGAQLTSILLPSAQLSGPFAYALTVESPLSVHSDKVVEQPPTHFILERPQDPSKVLMGVAGLPGRLELVESFNVEGKPLLLFRHADADIPRSQFERAVDALLRGDLQEAEERLLKVLEIDPHCSPAWTRLGQIRSIVNDHDSAYQCYMAAIQTDPARIQAHVSLANMYESRGYQREALHHLRQALAAEPGNPSLRDEVERYARHVEGP